MSRTGQRYPVSTVQDATDSPKLIPRADSDDKLFERCQVLNEEEVAKVVLTDGLILAPLTYLTHPQSDQRNPYHL